MSGFYNNDQNSFGPSGYAPVSSLTLLPGPKVPASECPPRNLEFMQQQMTAEKNSAMIYGSSPGYNSLMSAYGPAPTVAYASKYFNKEIYAGMTEPQENVFQYTIK
jgi:hypothetical protein